MGKKGADSPEPKVKRYPAGRLCGCGCGQKLSPYNPNKVAYAHSQKPGTALVGNRRVFDPERAEQQARYLY